MKLRLEKIKNIAKAKGDDILFKVQGQIRKEREMLEYSIKRIKEGMRFSSYKSLCEYLGVKVRSGESKSRQLQEFERYFELKQEGREIEVVMVYDKPKLMTINQHLENILLVNLIKSKEKHRGRNVLFGTRTAYYSMLGLVNFRYQDYKTSPKVLSDEFMMKYGNAVDLCEIVNATLDYRLQRLLNRLEGLKYIIKEEVMMNCMASESEVFALHGYGYHEISLSDEMGDTHRLATEREKEQYMNIQFRVLKELGSKDFQDIYAKKQVKKFYDRLSELSTKELGIKHMYKCYRVYFCTNFIKGRIKELNKRYNISPEELHEQKKFVNKRFIEQLKENGEKRRSKALGSVKDLVDIQALIELRIGFYLNMDKKTRTKIDRCSEEYLEDIGKYTKALIEINGLETLRLMQDS